MPPSARRLPVPALVLIPALALLAGAGLWTRPPGTVPTITQVQDQLLPPRSMLHSLVRVDLDGRPPQEIAVVARVPRLPGDGFASVGFLLAYDPWRRKIARVYAEPTPGRVPLSVDAGRLLGGRDVVVFQGMTDRGTRAYRLVGAAGGRPRILYEGEAVGPLIVTDAWIADAGAPGRVLQWDGRGFVLKAAPPPVRPAPRLTWRYAVWQRTIHAQTSVVDLAVRQPLQITSPRGGFGAIVIPDPRLDLLEQGYRARAPGIYTIRVQLPLASRQSAFVLTVRVR